jgi:hypothetical protein
MLISVSVNADISTITARNLTSQRSRVSVPTIFSAQVLQTKQALDN